MIDRLVFWKVGSDQSYIDSLKASPGCSASQRQKSKSKKKKNVVHLCRVAILRA